MGLDELLDPWSLLWQGKRAAHRNDNLPSKKLACSAAVVQSLPGPTDLFVNASAHKTCKLYVHAWRYLPTTPARCSYGQKFSPCSCVCDYCLLSASCKSEHMNLVSQISRRLCSAPKLTGKLWETGSTATTNVTQLLDSHIGDSMGGTAPPWSIERCQWEH